MATDPGTIDHLLDQLGTRGARFTTGRMFGEYCLYRDGLPVALVCDDTLFVKDTPPGREAMARIAEVDFDPPYPGARPHLRLGADLWDDGDALRRLLDATASALPAPKPPARDVAPAHAARSKAASKRAPTAASARAAPGAKALGDRAAGREATPAETPTARKAAAKKAPQRRRPTD